MPFYIHKPFVPAKTFVLNRALSLGADGKVVESTDPAAKRVLGARGHTLYEEEAAAYGLDDSHRLVEPDLKEIVAGRSAEFAKSLDDSVELTGTGVPAEPVAAVMDDLPDDFPGRKALSDAGITTFAQVRALENVQDIPGIGETKAAQIAEALGG